MTRLAPVRCGKSRPVVPKRRVGALTLRASEEFRQLDGTPEAPRY